MQFIELPKNHPLVREMKPGAKKEALVLLRCPTDEIDEPDDDTYALEVLKVDGIEVGPGDEEGEYEEDGETEMGGGDDGQGEPTFTALMFGKRKKPTAEVEVEE